MSADPSSTMISVVSLATATDRRAAFIAAADTDLAWSFLDAHTDAQADLQIDLPKMRVAAGRELKTSELGCYSSHYQTWKSFLVSGAHQLLVLEDDVIVDWNYVAFLIKHDLGAMGIEYLKLFVKVPGRFRRLRSPFLDPYHHLIEYLGPAFGTQAYCLSRRGASVLVDRLRHVSLAVDHAMDRSWDHGLATMAVFPSPILERFLPSSIGEARLLLDATSVRARVRNKATIRLEQGRRWTLSLTSKPRIRLPT